MNLRVEGEALRRKGHMSRELRQKASIAVTRQRTIGLECGFIILRRVCEAKRYGSESQNGLNSLHLPFCNVLTPSARLNAGTESPDG